MKKGVIVVVFGLVIASIGLLIVWLSYLKNEREKLQKQTEAARAARWKNKGKDEGEIKVLDSNIGESGNSDIALRSVV